MLHSQFLYAAFAVHKLAARNCVCAQVERASLCVLAGLSPCLFLALLITLPAHGAGQQAAAVPQPAPSTHGKPVGGNASGRDEEGLSPPSPMVVDLPSPFQVTARAGDGSVAALPTEGGPSPASEDAMVASVTGGPIAMAAVAPVLLLCLLPCLLRFVTACACCSGHSLRLLLRPASLFPLKAALAALPFMLLLWSKASVALPDASRPSTYGVCHLCRQ